MLSSNGFSAAMRASWTSTQRPPWRSLRRPSPRSSTVNAPVPPSESDMRDSTVALGLFARGSSSACWRAPGGCITRRGVRRSRLGRSAVAACDAGGAGVRAMVGLPTSAAGTTTTSGQGISGAVGATGLPGGSCGCWRSTLGASSSSRTVTGSGATGAALRHGHAVKRSIARASRPWAANTSIRVTNRPRDSIGAQHSVPGRAAAQRS